MDVKLDEKVQERLTYIGEQEAMFYVVDKGEVKPKDEKVIKMLEERIKEKKTDIYQDFLVKLRTSPMYKDEKKEDTKEDKSE